jgi:putative hemolysin
MSMLIGGSIGFLITLASTALFSYLETTITAVRFFRIRELAQTTHRYKKILTILEEQPHRILITILIACNLSNVIAAALSTRIMEDVFTQLQWSEGLGFSLGIAIATISILIFGEIIPKHFARLQGERMLGSSLWFINIIYIILYPAVKLLTVISNFFIGSHVKENSSDLVTSEKEIKFLIDYINQKGLIEREKSAMLQNIFGICNIQIKDILIPQPDMIMIDGSTLIEGALKKFTECQLSRLPIFEGKEDNIIGILYQKDIFIPLQKEEYTKSIKEIMRPVVFVPESMKVNQILKFFKDKHLHMAIVLDEHGAIAGLVTLEDVLEEIVGEIQDEHENDSAHKVITLQDGEWLVPGNQALDEVDDLLDITFDAEDAITLGGFLTEQLQHLPKKGERLTYKGYVFQIQKATTRRILQVLILKKPES